MSRTIALPLDDEHASMLEQTARKLGVSPEAAMLRALEQLAQDPEQPSLPEWDTLKKEIEARFDDAFEIT